MKSYTQIFWDITPCSCWKSTDVSEEHVASIFGVEQWVKHESSMKQAASVALLPTSLIYSLTVEVEAKCSSETSARTEYSLDSKWGTDAIVRGILCRRLKVIISSRAVMIIILWWFKLSETLQKEAWATDNLWTVSMGTSYNIVSALQLKHLKHHLLHTAPGDWVGAILLVQVLSVTFVLAVASASVGILTMRRCTFA
jgi:hypothetical protein